MNLDEIVWTLLMLAGGLNMTFMFFVTFASDPLGVMQSLMICVLLLVVTMKGCDHERC